MLPSNGIRFPSSSYTKSPKVSVSTTYSKSVGFACLPIKGKIAVSYPPLSKIYNCYAQILKAAKLPSIYQPDIKLLYPSKISEKIQNLVKPATFNN